MSFQATKTLTGFMEQRLSGKVLDSQSRVSCTKPQSGSKVNLAFHVSEVDKISTRNFWKLIGKK